MGDPVEFDYGENVAVRIEEPVTLGGRSLGIHPVSRVGQLAGRGAVESVEVYDPSAFRDLSNLVFGVVQLTHDLLAVEVYSTA